MSHYNSPRTQPQAHYPHGAFPVQRDATLATTTTTSQHFNPPRNPLAQTPRPHNNHARHYSQTQLRRTQSTLPHPAANAVTHILPFCTTKPPLRRKDVIALSDVVGSLRELVLLALSAAGEDAVSVGRLEGALGVRAAEGVVEFFAEEWEVE